VPAATIGGDLHEAAPREREQESPIRAVRLTGSRHRVGLAAPAGHGLERLPFAGGGIGHHHAVVGYDHDLAGAGGLEHVRDGRDGRRAHRLPRVPLEEQRRAGAGSDARDEARALARALLAPEGPHLTVGQLREPAHAGPTALELEVHLGAASEIEPPQAVGTRDPQPILAIEEDRRPDPQGVAALARQVL